MPGQINHRHHALQRGGPRLLRPNKTPATVGTKALVKTAARRELDNSKKRLRAGDARSQFRFDPGLQNLGNVPTRVPRSTIIIHSITP